MSTDELYEFIHHSPLVHRLRNYLNSEKAPEDGH